MVIAGRNDGIGKSGRPIFTPVQKNFSIFLNSEDEKNGMKIYLIL